MVPILVELQSHLESLRAPCWVHYFFPSTSTTSPSCNCHPLPPDDHLLQLNPQKCKSMILSKKRCSTAESIPLYLCGSKLEEATIYKYLGVLVNKNLTWSDHISELCTKARKILGLLYRQFYNNANPATIRQLYISLVWPHLEYASHLGSLFARRYWQTGSSAEVCSQTNFSTVGLGLWRVAKCYKHSKITGKEAPPETCVGL